LQATVARQLRRGRLRAGVDPDLEAAVIAGLVPSLAQSVLDGMQTAPDAVTVIDYALDRAFRR
jgi:hypothetical protein